MSLRVGFIGLGHMGAPMCEQLLRAGLAVTAFDVRADAVQALAAKVAEAAASALDCAAAVDVLITMLPGPAVVEAVLLGEGALDALASGSVAIDMSTGPPDLVRRLASAGAARGVAVLDAPVADALKAAQGMLHVFVGGDEDDVARVLPVLEAMGDPDGIVHVGPHGAGQVVKLLVNPQWFVHAAAAAEELTGTRHDGDQLTVALDGFEVREPHARHRCETPELVPTCRSRPRRRSRWRFSSTWRERLAPRARFGRRVACPRTPFGGGCWPPDVVDRGGRHDARRDGLRKSLHSGGCFEVVGRSSRQATSAVAAQAQPGASLGRQIILLEPIFFEISFADVDPDVGDGHARGATS